MGDACIGSTIVSIQCHGTQRLIHVIHIGVNITTFGRKLTLFLAPSRFSLKMTNVPLFCVFLSWKKCAVMYRMRSAQRQMKLRRLGNQLPVLCKANSLCEDCNISLQPGTVRNDSKTVFCNIRSPFHRVFFFLLLTITVRTPHAEYYVLCLFGGMCAATSTF